MLYILRAPRRFEITVDGCAHKLVIHDANLQDIGDYTVTIGDVSSTAHLDIEGTQAALLAFEAANMLALVHVQCAYAYIQVYMFYSFLHCSSKCHFSSIVCYLGLFSSYKTFVSVSSTLTEIPVTFIVPLSDVTVQEQQNVKLTCQVNKPGVTLTWTKDGAEIAKSERCDIEIEGTVHSLHIMEALLSDEGEYRVTVGVSVSRAKLTVEGTSRHCRRQRVARQAHC